MKGNLLKRNLRVEAVAVVVTALVLLLSACPGPQGTVVRKQYQPIGNGITVERWCLHVQPPNKDTKPLIYCREDQVNYNKYKVGDKYP